MKFKRINRGLILGAVLIAGTVGYVIVDNIRFKDSKSDIDKTVNDYFSRISEANVSDDSKKTAEKVGEIVSDCWIYDKAADYNYSGLTGLLESVNSYRGSGYTPTEGKIEEYNMDINITSIRKNSPNGAVVVLGADFYCVFTGKPSVFEIDAFYDLSNMMYSYGDEDDEDEEENDTVTKYTYSGGFDNITVQLYYTDGEWKITSMEYYSEYMNDIVPLDETRDKSGETDA